MKVVVSGATGLIGKVLCKRLLGDGHVVTALARSPDRAIQQLPGATAVRWDALGAPPGPEALEGADAIVHLSGEPIAAGRWTATKKKRILESRIQGTQGILDALSQCGQKPKVLVSGSAVGFYGDRGDEILDEENPSGQGFPADVANQWEHVAQQAQAHHLRVVLLRTGIVLSTQGGALPRMLPPFRLFVGGPLGSGRQWMSWIHIQDEVEIIRLALSDERVEGPINLTAPQPVTNREFSSQLGRVLKRPALLPVPAFALRLLLGEMAQALLLEGQRVLPRRLQALGYSFRYPGPEAALRDLLE